MDLRRRLPVILAWICLLCSATGIADAESPVAKKEFPLATPFLGGYTLVDAFPA